jgi:hypothetical protein
LIFAVRRAAGTASRFAFGQDDVRSFVFDTAQEIGQYGLDQLSFNAALAPVSSAQSLENPHLVLLDDG